MESGRKHKAATLLEQALEAYDGPPGHIYQFAVSLLSMLYVDQG